MDTKTLINDASAPSLPADLAAIAGRFAMPYLLFSTLLAVVMFVSYVLLLPRFTTVDIGGQKRSQQEISVYRGELVQEIQDKEDIRRKHVLSLVDPQYDFLKSLRLGITPLPALQAQVLAQAASVAGDGAVVISDSEYDPVQKTLRLRGDVHGVGSRSMTVLAAFADALGALPTVESVSAPSFTRLDDGAAGPHSPFDIVLTLQ